MCFVNLVAPLKDMEVSFDSSLFSFPTTIPLDVPGGSDGKEFACNVGDLVSNPASGRSPREGNGYPVQYSCLENSMDRGTWRAIVHGVAKSWTPVSDFHFTSNHSISKSYCYFHCISGIYYFFSIPMATTLA